MKNQRSINGSVANQPAPDFKLLDQNSNWVQLSDLLAKSSVLLAFYPGDFTLVCTKQLCNYRDTFTEFKDLGIQIVGVSANPPESHGKFSTQFQFQFPLLCDTKKTVAKLYGCTSLLMLGKISRAIFIINQRGRVLYRYVEPTPLTRRTSGELLGIIQDLKKHGLI